MGRRVREETKNLQVKQKYFKGTFSFQTHQFSYTAKLPTIFSWTEYVIRQICRSMFVQSCSYE